MFTAKAAITVKLSFMKNKPELKLIMEAAALEKLAPANDADAVTAFIKHVENHFRAEITWCVNDINAAPAFCAPGHTLASLNDNLPYAGKNTVIIANSPALTSAALENDIPLVTANARLASRAAYTLLKADNIRFLQKLLTPLNSGKIPNELLGSALEEISCDDPELLINPGIGEDTAAIDVTQTEILVLKSDPITFASSAISQYAVLVNANDIATAGARPRWFMATLLFPRFTTGLTVRHIILELSRYCRKWRIVLAGGHTEITDAVTRPVVIGMMAGTVPKNRLLNKKNIQDGDVMILTKAVAVEGTALIAKEMAAELLKAGMSQAEIGRCAHFLDMIGILPEAEIAMQHNGVIAMHDVTEGGLATAALEMAVACGLGLSVNINAIPVYPETAKICSILNINPLGLISSGCLLIACRPKTALPLINAIESAGIKATAIGHFTYMHPGRVEPAEPGQTWPVFAVDEIARLTQNNG